MTVGVAPAPKPVNDRLAGNPKGALWDEEKADDMAAAVGICDVASVGLPNDEPKIDVAAP